jgi:hypothetical protein
MSRLILIRPGQVSGWVTLQEVLREAHQAAQKDRAEEIEHRKKNGIPLDDDTDWSAVAVAVAARKSAEIAKLTSGHELTPIADYVDVEGYDNIKARFIAIPEAKRRTLTLAVAAAADAVNDARRAGDTQGVDDACLERDRAYGAFVQATVRELDVSGEVLNGITDDDVDALFASGLLLSVYSAARDYQRLSPGKGRRFGSPAQST